MSRDKIEALGERAILAKIAEGVSQAEIAREVDVGASTLNEWLHATHERSARAKAAMTLSAEAWLDRGLQALISAEPDAAEIARARAIEQHCARRAAVRDPKRYGDRTVIAGDPDAPLAPSIDLSKTTTDQLRALASISLADLRED